MKLFGHDFKNFRYERRRLRVESERERLQTSLAESIAEADARKYVLSDEEIAKNEARAAAKAEHNRLAALRRKARFQPMNWAMFGLTGGTTAYIEGSRAEERDESAIAKAIRSTHNNGVRRRYRKLMKDEDRRAESIRRTAPGFVIGKKTRADRKRQPSKRAQHLEAKTARTSYAERKNVEAEIYTEAMRRWSKMDPAHRPRLRSVQAVVAAERGAGWRDYTQNGGLQI